MEVTIMYLGLSLGVMRRKMFGGCPIRVALRLCVSASLPVGLLRSAARRRLRQPEVPGGRMESKMETTILKYWYIV